MQTLEAFSAAEPAGAARRGRATNDEIRQVIAAKDFRSVAHDDKQTRSMLATITAAKTVQSLPPADDFRWR
jgi:DNA polymerase/3'-5' exonuclease PolX